MHIHNPLVVALAAASAVQAAVKFDLFDSYNYNCGGNPIITYTRPGDYVLGKNVGSVNQLEGRSYTYFSAGSNGRCGGIVVHPTSGGSCKATVNPSVGCVRVEN